MPATFAKAAVATGQHRTVVYLPWSTGDANDEPDAADYDGDGRADLAYYKASDRTWYIKQSSNGATVTRVFGTGSTDVRVPADYDGDGKADPANYLPGAATWPIVFSNGRQAVVRLESAQARAGLVLGLMPGAEDRGTGTAWLVRTDRTVGAERRRGGGLVWASGPQALRGQSDAVVTVRLSADVTATAVVFAIDGEPVLTVPASEVDTDGAPGLWVGGGPVAVETLAITTGGQP